jgi:FkbM family methyltransferase
MADIRDPFPRAYMLSGVFEPEFFAIAVPILRRGGVFLDVGANFGFCSFGLVHALAGAPPVDYHLFEANARLCAVLERTATLHPHVNVTITRGCVTRAPGTSRLHVVAGHSGASYIAPNGEEEAPNIVLDHYLDERGLDQVSLLKLDIEGLEPLALQGAARSLRAARIRAVYLEVSTDLLGRQGLAPTDALAPLVDAGFTLYYVRRSDFDLGVADARSAVSVDINDTWLRLAPVGVDGFPSSHQTDLLAIHRSVELESAGRRCPRPPE